MQLISMYSSKQRTGVLDLEAGLEAYIIPPCVLVDRLLKTAKKSATMASHMANSIPDTIEDSQLLLVVIHRKVLSSQGKTCKVAVLQRYVVYINCQVQHVTGDDIELISFHCS